MQTDSNLFSLRQLVLLTVVALVVLPVSIFFYHSRHNQYAAGPVKSTDFTIANPAVLTNWLPQSAYETTVARLKDFAKSNTSGSTGLVVKSGVSNDNGAFGFDVLFDQEGETHHVDVTVLDYDGVLTTSVAVDYDQQAATIGGSSQSTGDIQVTGLSSLVSNGLTSYQAKAFQQALRTFKNSGTFIIDTTNINQKRAADSSNPDVLSFPISIDNHPYAAKLEYSDLTVVNLFLNDQTSSKQVFNSGSIDGTNL